MHSARRNGSFATYILHHRQLCQPKRGVLESAAADPLRSLYVRYALMGGSSAILYHQMVQGPLADRCWKVYLPWWLFGSLGMLMDSEKRTRYHC